MTGLGAKSVIKQKQVESLTLVKAKKPEATSSQIENFPHYRVDKISEGIAHLELNTKELTNNLFYLLNKYYGI